MSLKVKRGLLIGSLLVLTIVCYLIMNRNYDPLSRYPYELDEDTRELILDNMNELEIKYIIDYSIQPGEFVDYIEDPKFNAYFISLYNEADEKLYLINTSQIVPIVNRIEELNLDFEKCMDKYSFMFYDSIMGDLSK